MREWWEQTEDKFIQAVGEANNNLFRARIGAGMGRTYIGHNRRKVLPDESVKMFWRNAEKEPTHPVDPTVSVLRIDDISGSPKAVLVNYSCHPTVLGPDNLHISADYVGVMRRHVEKEIPGATCLFIFGASGDINPYFDKQPITEKPFEAVGWTGETLGKAVVQTARRIETEPGNEKGIQYASKVHEFQHRFNAGQRVKIATGVGLLNGKIGFVSFSADPFVEHQIPSTRSKRHRDDLRLCPYVHQRHTLCSVPTHDSCGGGRRLRGGLRHLGGSRRRGDAGGPVVVQLLKLMGLLQPVPGTRY